MYSHFNILSGQKAPLIAVDACGIIMEEHQDLSPQLLLVCMKEDSVEGIYDTLKECAVISKSVGGIGVSVRDIQATGSYTCGTNGNSNAIVPMLSVFNDAALYVDQGGGKRKGLNQQLCWISIMP